VLGMTLVYYYVVWSGLINWELRKAFVGSWTIRRISIFHERRYAGVWKGFIGAT